MVFESILQNFRPFPILAILLISFVTTLIVTLIYKWTTKQAELRKLKKEIKDIQNQLKTLSKTDPKKAMAIQKKAMEKNFQMMKHSFKPTLYTFLPLIIIFAWLNGHMAYYELSPGTEFTVTAEFDKYFIGNATIQAVPDLTILTPIEQQVKDGRAAWTLKGDAGQYTITIRDVNHEFTKNILISPEWRYDNPIQTYSGTSVKKIIIGNPKIHPFGSWFNLFGWYPGWLAAYIISSIVFSTLLRRLMKLA